MKAVIDTHVLFWLLTNQQEKITLRAFKLLHKADEVIIPTVVLLELLGLCIKKQKLDAFDTFISEISESDYIVYPLDLMSIKATRAIEDSLELHDKAIVATAKMLDLRLITKDEQITKIYKRVIW